MGNISPIICIPGELHAVITSFLEAKDVIHCALTCKGVTPVTTSYPHKLTHGTVTEYKCVCFGETFSRENIQYPDTSTESTNPQPITFNLSRTGQYTGQYRIAYIAKSLDCIFYMNITNNLVQALVCLLFGRLPPCVVITKTPVPYYLLIDELIEYFSKCYDDKCFHSCEGYAYICKIKQIEMESEGSYQTRCFNALEKY
jgi:hypothetical protein